MSDNLDRVIHGAFKGVDYPGDDTLTASMGEEELSDTRCFAGKKWDAVDAETISANYYALFWFTPEAFHYYLPSFLVAGVEQPRSTFVITILLLLKPADDANKGRFKRERWSRLSDEQVDALEQWLVDLRQAAPPGAEGEIDDALRVVRERYWWK